MGCSQTGRSYAAIASKIGQNSGSSSGRPPTFVNSWIPIAPSSSIARRISTKAAGTLLSPSEATKPGNRSGRRATSSAIESLASRASAGVWSGPATLSRAGMESVRICR